MVSHICTRCGKSFKKPYWLRKHHARKTPCAPILELDDLSPEAREDPDLDKKKCQFCGRVLSSYVSMRRHVRKSCKIAPNKKNGNTGMEKLYAYTIKKQQAQINEMATMMKKQSQLVSQLLGGTQGSSEMQGGGNVPLRGLQTIAQATGEVVVSGNNNRFQIDNSKKININIFGQENTSHITAAQVERILEQSLGNPALTEAAQTAILEAAMLIYSDPSHPENLTCYLPNKKTNDALVKTQKGWEVRPVSLVLPSMITRGIDILFELQPFERAQAFEPLMKELKVNEGHHMKGTGQMRPILVRNKALLEQALRRLPTARDKN